MLVKFDNKRTKRALDLLVKSSGNEKRVLSPDPENEPYWHHHVRVYQYLNNFKVTDEKILIAALLHDSIEDNKLSKEELLQNFGSTTYKIIDLLSEKVHTDHSIINNRNGYFDKIEKYKNKYIREAAMKIKIMDRYDNLIGLSFTKYKMKKKQYTDEVNNYLNNWAIKLGYVEKINEGLLIMKGTKKPPSLKVEIDLKHEASEILF